MRELAHWLEQVRYRKSRESLAIISASLVAVVLVACIGCLAVATIAGAILLRRSGTGEQAAIIATDATGGPGTSGPAGTLPPAELPAVDHTSQPIDPTPPTGSIQPSPTPPTSTLALTEAIEITATPPPTITLEPPEPLLPADTQVSTTTIAPASALAPDSALELTPTTQLTLSPVIFVENVGQLAADVRFQARGAVGGGVWLAPDAIWITLVEPLTISPGQGGQPPDPTQAELQQGVHLKLSFVGANPNPQLVPFDQLDTHVSYLTGSDPAGWHARVPVWGGVRYQDLYPGIDLELTSEKGRYVQRLVAHSGADLSTVQLQIDGVEALALEPLPLAEDGSENEREAAMPQSSMSPGEASTSPYYLRLTTELGEFSLPLIPLTSPNGSPLEGSGISSPELAVEGNIVRFPFRLPDEEEPGLGQKRSGLPDSGSTAAPTSLLYSVFVGQGGSDVALGIAVDGTGLAYVTGHTYVPEFPLVAGVFDAGSNGHYNAYVVKLKANGSETAFVSFWGGSGYEGGYALALDQAGNAYVTGATDSADLPATAGAFDVDANGGYDAFVLKMDSTGTNLAYATLLGGNGDEWGLGIAVDTTGNAYVTGATRSTDFPVTTGAWDTTGNGQDAWVARLNGTGAGLVYSTFLGGGGLDEGNEIALDGAGQAYIVGTTQSSDFPTSPAAFASGLNGASDAFLAKLNEPGTDLVYATYLGGSSAERGTGVALDSTGHAYVAGSTQSADFPVTAWGFDPHHDGGQDAFVVKIKPGETELDYASFFGDSGDDWAQAIRVDKMGYAYVTGSTQSPADPQNTDSGETDLVGDHDAFVIRVGELGTELAYVTQVGGSGQDQGLDIAVDQLGCAYIAGSSESSDLPAITRGSQPADLDYVPLRPANIQDAFIAKLVVGTPFLEMPVSYSNFAQAALGNMNDKGPGRVNSWFDHSYPNHTQNRKLIRWDGQVAQLTASSPPRIGESWYDGHGGTDFQWQEKNEPIYAAAPGTVIDTYTACREGDTSCDSAFGNRVWIDHGNGYATVYAHLNDVYASVGAVITDPTQQPLGTMGNTGRSLGTHLHLGLYFDRDGDGQWSRGEVVDPYGWAGSGKDPWAGPSRYLWKHSLWDRQLVMGEEVRLASPSQLVAATIPGMAFGSTALVELWDVPSGTLGEMPDSEEDAIPWRSTGHTFRLTATGFEASAESTPPRISLNSVEAEAQPIALTVAYRSEDLQRLDPSQLIIRRWDDRGKTWTDLPTTVDTTRNLVTAQTMELGKFDLHAPLSCSTDAYEPDDHYAAATLIPAAGFEALRSFDIAHDQDWFRIEAEGGAIYVAETKDLSEGLNTILSLHNPVTLATLATSDSRRTGGASYLKWRVPHDGSYLLRISRVAGSPYGCDSTYVLGLRELHPPDRVAIAGPETGIVAASYAFTATVEPITITQPIIFSWQVTDESDTVFSVGTGESITLTWSATGTHRIVVTATNEGGLVSGTHSVVVSAAPSASFTATPLSGRAPLEVSFTNTSGEGYTESWWDFGDDKASRADNPSHTYTTPGIYTVTLTITGPGGSDTETKAAYVTVEGGVPRGTGEYTVHLPIVVRQR